MSTEESPEVQTLKELLEVMHEHDLDAVKVTVDGKIFEMVRREGGAVPVFAPAAAAQGPAPAASSSGGAMQAPAHVKKVTAPLVGVFYRASSPDAEPFVQEGDRVEAGAVICILEAMKLFNEITSDHAGVVTRIVPENGELVSLGQDLFWIEP